MTIDNKIKTSVSSKNNNVLKQDSLEEVAQSQDANDNTLGTLTISSNDLSDSDNVNKTDKKIINLSPKEQFQAAFDNLRSQNFEEAKFYLGYSIIFVFIILIIDGFTQFIFGKNIFFFELQKYNSELSYVTSFFNDEKKLGSFLSRMFPLLAITFILLIYSKIILILIKWIIIQ